ncbi:MAG: hypothetical protein Q9159_006497, partial [Coniocarpon cinnabarinum]
MATTATPSDTTAEVSRRQILTSFTSTQDDYETRMGTITRPLATHIISSLSHTLPHSPHIHDNACGTGAVTSSFLSQYPNGKVTATDASPLMISALYATIQRNDWNSKVSAHVMDSQSLNLRDNSFDASVLHCSIWFFPDPLAAVKAIYRTLRKPGVVAITTGKETPLTPIFSLVQDQIKPVSPSIGVSGFNKWAEPSTLIELLTEAGFGDVDVSEIEEVQWADDLEGLAKALSGNFNIMAGSWSPEEKGRIAEVTRGVLEKGE